MTIATWRILAVGCGVAGAGLGMLGLTISGVELVPIGLAMAAAGVGLALCVERSLHSRATQGPTAEELEYLRELHRLRVVSDEEFERKRRGILEG